MYNSIAQAILRFLFESKHFLIKCFLLASFVFSTGFSAYLVILSIIAFFDNDAITNSGTIVQHSAQFPKITNPFITRSAVDFLKNISSTHIFNTTFMKSLIFEKKRNFLDEIYNLSLAKMKSRDANENRKFFHSLSDILFECKFYDSPCNREEDFN